jgi:hypothetical protein
MLVKNRGAMANYGWKTTIIVLNSCDYVFTSEDMANIEWEIDSYSAAVSDITSESNFIMRFNLTDSAISFTYRAMFGTPEPDSEIILF